MLNNILISRNTRKVLSKDNRFIGIEGENLQEVLVFNLDKELDGQGIVEIQFRDETKGYIELEKTERGYELPIKSSLLTQEGIIKMQLKIVQEGQEIFKSETIRFNVEKAINATETIPEEYPTWIDSLETLKLELEKAEKERAEAEQNRANQFEKIQEDVDNAVQEIENNVKEEMKPILENIENISKQAETIARGRATGYVFDTLQDLDLWLNDSENISKLVLGDNFYIRAIDIPDYWWDGIQKQQLEAEKPILTGFVKEEELEDYATKTYVNNLIGDIEKELGGI